MLCGEGTSIEQVRLTVSPAKLVSVDAAMLIFGTVKNKARGHVSSYASSYYAHHT